MSELETISGLMRDIADFRNTIAYFEGRILRKQIAMEEIVHSAEACAELNGELVILPKKTPAEAFVENGSRHGRGSSTAIRRSRASGFPL